MPNDRDGRFREFGQSTLFRAGEGIFYKINTFLELCCLILREGACSFPVKLLEEVRGGIGRQDFTFTRMHMVRGEESAFGESREVLRQNLHDEIMMLLVYGTADVLHTADEITIQCADVARIA